MFHILNIALQYCLFTIYASNIISARITGGSASQDNSWDPITLKSIGVQVGDNGCNCWMYVEIIDSSYPWRSCVTNYLDDPGNDFVGGTYQSFSSPESLGDCYQNQFSSTNNIKMNVVHSGLDGVQIEYWNIMYDNGAKSYCKDNSWYDGNSKNIDIHCKLEGCNYSGYRYIPEEGYIPGPGLIGEYQTSGKQCEIDCNFRDECKAYSYSTPDGICKLIPQYYPTADNYKSHQFCRKNETVCSFTEDTYIEGADESLPSIPNGVNTKEECSLRVKNYFPDSTGCIWDEKHKNCRGKYGNSQKGNGKGNNWESCLFFGQSFWPLEAANKMCAYYSKATGVKSQILCQDMCTSEDRCIGISYSEDNTDGYEDDSLVWNCYICYSDGLIDSEPGSKIGFKRRPE